MSTVFYKNLSSFFSGAVYPEAFDAAAFSRAALLQKAAALPVPFVAQSVDLVGNLADPCWRRLVVLNDPQQALAGAEQPLEHGSGAVCTLACPLLHTDLCALLQADCTLGTNGPLRTIVGAQGGKALLGQVSTKRFSTSSSPWITNTRRGFSVKAFTQRSRPSLSAWPDMPVS